jgi:hypothetical protein
MRSPVVRDRSSPAARPSKTIRCYNSSAAYIFAEPRYMFLEN